MQLQCFADNLLHEGNCSSLCRDFVKRVMQWNFYPCSAAEISLKRARSSIINETQRAPPPPVVVEAPPMVVEAPPVVEGAAVVAEEAQPLPTLDFLQDKFRTSRITIHAVPRTPPGRPP